MRPTRTRSLRRIVAIALALLVATPEVVLAAEGTTATKSLDRMSPEELERFVQQLNESANWRKYRRPGDPPDFVPGKPVRVMHGAGSAMRRGGGGGGAGFRKSGLASRRGSRGGRGKNRDDALSQSRSNSRSNRSNSGSGSGSRSRSSFGGSSRNSSTGNGGNAFGNDGGGGAFDQ